MGRPHTGRARNPAARRAVLDATLAILREGDAVTVDGIARRAAVGKQTIYRWWPSAGAVVFEAASEMARITVPDRDTGRLLGDLEAFLGATFRASRDPAIVAVLRTLMAESLRDERLTESFHAFLGERRGRLRAILDRGVERGEIPSDGDLDLLVDTTYGLLWYRILVGHRSLDAGDAQKLAGIIVRVCREGLI